MPSLTASSTPTRPPTAPSFLPSFVVADEKDGTPKHKPATSLPRFQYWQPNAHQTLWLLVVDLDHEDSLLRFMQAIRAGVPLPWYIIEKGCNGHVQAGWPIEHVSTGPRSRTQPQRYAHAVRRALSLATEGDPHFTNGRCWNPYWAGWADRGRVIWGDPTARTLGALSSALDAAGLWQAEPAPRGPVRPAHGHGRNVHVFDVARLRSSGTVAQAAEAANAALPDPMRPAEVAGIVRSIEGYEARTGRRGSGGAMSAEERARQAERGRKGGAPGTSAQKLARAQGPAAAAVIRSAEAVGREAQIRALYEAGKSRAEIMTATGYGRTLVYRVLRGC